MSRREGRHPLPQCRWVRPHDKYHREEGWSNCLLERDHDGGHGFNPDDSFEISGWILNPEYVEYMNSLKYIREKVLTKFTQKWRTGDPGPTTLSAIFDELEKEA